MPFDANGKWVPVMDANPTGTPTPAPVPVRKDDSVASRLTGLMATDSKYLTQARAAGTRTANRRGLMNSSIAAGSSEAAAIAAAAPIASQDASTAAARNQARLEGDIQYDNSSRLQGQQDEGAMNRQLSGQQAQTELTRLDSKLATLRQRENQGFELNRQERDNIATLERQREGISSNERQALLGAEVSMRNTDITAANDSRSMYLQAFSNLTANSKLKPADRNAYIAEFQRVTNQSKPLQQTLSGVTLNWASSPPPPAPAPAAPA